tara:strand:+ start:1027 stop:1485 length:459 start_codon:yes stop_codon:yes gene_type:complete
MKKKQWGPVIWKVLHCLTMKIKNEEFNNHREELIKIITNICSNLPCPQCTSHASGIIKKYKMKDIKSKEALIKFIHSMHNMVNQRLKRPQFPFESIEKEYNRYNIKTVLTEYYRMNINAKYSEKLMLHSYRRKIFLNKFYGYCNKNISKFDH